MRRWRIIQAAERARQAMAHSATGCAVVSGVTGGVVRFLRGVADGELDHLRHEAAPLRLVRFRAARAAPVTTSL